MDLKDYSVYIFDYEGTLSEAPNHKLTLEELLYNFNFKNLEPNKQILNFFNSIQNKEIYVVGIIETNKEIQQKTEWLNIHYPTIRKENYVFISSDYKKSEAILAIINKNNYKKSEILFIDDKISHINDVSKLGIKSVLTKNIN